MTLSLIYHSTSCAPSPFDACAVDLSRSADLRIACPYLSLDYLRRLIALSASWRLVTDVEEWISSIPSKERKLACDFIIDSRDCIRHSANLHAKVLIGASHAMVGSANLTASGIQRPNEMAVRIDDPDCHGEICKWFDDTWDSGLELSRDQVRQMAKSLPNPPPAREPILGSARQQPYAPLTTLDEDRDIRTYLGARGYYLGKRFCVMKGSMAKRDVVDAFRKTNDGLYNSIREDLIRRGILSRSHVLADYVFTQDYVFNSASAAACVVSGQSRSGPKEWGPP